MIDPGLRREHLYWAARVDVTLGSASGDVRHSSGTGFLSMCVMPEDPGRYYPLLITNHHVVDPSKYDGHYRGYEPTRVRIAFEQLHGGSPIGRTLEWNFCRQHTVTPANLVEDAAVIAVDASDAAVVAGPTESELPARIYFTPDVIAAQEEFGEAVGPGDFLAINGYPALFGDQLEYPIVVPGLISSDPARSISVDQRGEGRIFLVHSFSRTGMSGSPVFAVQRGIALGGGLTGLPHRPARLVGVNAGHVKDPDGVSMISYAVRSDVLLELIDVLRERLRAGERQNPVG